MATTAIRLKSGMAVTDELALDLDTAVSALAHATERAAVPLRDDLVREVQRLTALTSVPQTTHFGTTRPSPATRPGLMRVKTRGGCFP